MKAKLEISVANAKKIAKLDSSLKKVNCFIQDFNSKLLTTF